MLATYTAQGFASVEELYKSKVWRSSPGIQGRTVKPVVQYQAPFDIGIPSFVTRSSPGIQGRTVPPRKEYQPDLVDFSVPSRVFPALIRGYKPRIGSVAINQPQFDTTLGARVFVPLKASAAPKPVGTMVTAWPQLNDYREITRAFPALEGIQGPSPYSIPEYCPEPFDSSSTTLTFRPTSTPAAPKSISTQVFGFPPAFDFYQSSTTIRSSPGIQGVTVTPVLSTQQIADWTPPPLVVPSTRLGATPALAVFMVTLPQVDTATTSFAVAPIKGPSAPSPLATTILGWPQPDEYKQFPQVFGAQPGPFGPGAYQTPEFYPQPADLSVPSQIFRIPFAPQVVTYPIGSVILASPQGSDLSIAPNVWQSKRAGQTPPVIGQILIPPQQADLTIQPKVIGPAIGVPSNLTSIVGGPQLIDWSQQAQISAALPTPPPSVPSNPATIFAAPQLIDWSQPAQISISLPTPPPAPPPVPVTTVPGGSGAWWKLKRRTWDYYLHEPMLETLADVYRLLEEEKIEEENRVQAKLEKNKEEQRRAQKAAETAGRNALEIANYIRAELSKQGARVPVAPKKVDTTKFWAYVQELEATIKRRQQKMIDDDDDDIAEIIRLWDL